MAVSTAGRARLGISLFFLTNGALYANILPRLPELKASMGLSNAAFGLTVAAVAVGSVVTAHWPAVLMRRIGPLRQALGGTAILATCVGLLGFAPGVWAFAGLLFLVGATDAFVDAAQNVHGLRVQRACGRSIINSLHALWSAGAALGGVMGTLAARADLPVSVHLPLSSLLFAVVAAVATFLSRLPHSVGNKDCEPSGAEDDVAPPAGGPAPVHGAAGLPARAARRAGLLTLGLLVTLAICGTLVEDVGSTWAALFLVQVCGLAASAAGIGYVTLIGAQLVGRLAGDPMTDRLGRVTTARIGGAMIATGFALTVFVATPVAALAGFALAGFGSATLVPAAFAAADDIPGLKHGTGVTLLGWLMRLGFLGTSPAIGALSGLVTLRWALVLAVVAGVIAVAVAPVLRRR